eukprot:262925-Rhodomonas_salina.2
MPMVCFDCEVATPPCAGFLCRLQSDKRGQGTAGREEGRAGGFSRAKRMGGRLRWRDEAGLG